MAGEAYRRKKNPHAVRLALLENAAIIAAREGLSAVTLQSVAVASGVTKGGLLHHFPNRPALVKGMVLAQIEKFEVKIDEVIAADAIPYGCFTRAYVNVAFNRQEFGEGTAWKAMAATVTADSTMREIWNRWMAYRLERHHETDSDWMLEMVRLAADGAWYSCIAEDLEEEEQKELVSRLLSLTCKPHPGNELNFTSEVS